MFADHRIRFWLLVAAAVAAFVWIVGPVLSPFLVGMLVGYLLDPVCDRMERWGMPRSAAAGVVIGCFYLVVAAAIALLIPFAWTQLSDLVASIPSIQAKAVEGLQPYWEMLKPHLDDATLSKAQDVATSSLGTLAETFGTVVRGAVAGGFAVVDVATFMVIAPVVGFYILKDWDHIVAWVDRHLPQSAAPAIRRQAAQIDSTLSSWLRGQALVCLILATFYATCLTVAGLRYGLLIGLFTGLCAFIPFVGFGLGLISALVAAFFSFGGMAGWIAVGAVFAIGQFVEGYVLTPKLVGRSVGLHEVWVMFALLAGAHLFGFVGVLLAVPVTAVIGVGARSAMAVYRESRYFTGDDVAPRMPSPSS